MASKLLFILICCVVTLFLLLPTIAQPTVGETGFDLDGSIGRSSGVVIPQPMVLTVANIAGNPESLDPAVDYETVGGEVIQNVYETLHRQVQSLSGRHLDEEVVDPVDQPISVLGPGDIL